MRQSATFSSYKSHNTMKCMIGIAPHGHVSFVLPVFDGSAIDKRIVQASGLLQLLEKETQSWLTKDLTSTICVLD